MLLTRLYELSQRKDIKHKLPPEMYGNVKPRWFIEIDGEGKLLKPGFLDLGKDALARRMPDIVRSSGVKPKLLVDNGEYVLGVSSEGGDQKKIANRHLQFKALVQECADVTQEASVQAIAAFLESWNPDVDCSKIPDSFSPADVVTFQVHLPESGTIIPADADADLEKVQKFWADKTANPDSPTLTCLVTGEERKVEERLPVKIKRIPNGQTAGTSLVSANAPPFTSYGLANSLTSPISRKAAEGFGKALNYLIGNEDTHFYLHSTVYVFWTRKPTIHSLIKSVKQDRPAKVRKIFKAACEGRRKKKLRANDLYALGLTASGGRAVVRDWISITLEDAMQNLVCWWDAQEIVNEFGVYNENRYLRIKALAESLYRDPNKDAVDRFSVQLLHVAFQGGTLPLEILAQIVRRNRAEQQVTYRRAALLKLVLSTHRKYRTAMAKMQCLNPEPDFEDIDDNTAYHCGRLLAQLERIQETALGRDVYKTLIDRYYGAASTTPGKVFGPLVKDAQAHLGKLRKSEKQRGAYEALQQKLEEIFCQIPAQSDTWPNNLTMQQQSIFSLGYYHQRAQNRKDALDAKAKRQKKAEASGAEIEA